MCTFPTGIGAAVGDLLAAQVEFASMACLWRCRTFNQATERIAVRRRALPLLLRCRRERSGLPGFEVTSWYGVFGPLRAARRHRRELNSEIGSAVRRPRQEASPRWSRALGEAPDHSPGTSGRKSRNGRKWSRTRRQGRVELLHSSCRRAPPIS